MGIYIEGIEMPTKGNPITVLIYPDGMAEWSARNKIGRATRIPAHGRLIDADKADSRFTPDFTELSDFQCGWNAAMKRVCEDAPTIIPADKEEEET